MAVVEGAYCNATTDLQQRGTYLKKNISTITSQTNWDLEQMVLNAADYIDVKLYSAGISVPVATKHTNARRRLRYLNALLVNAWIERALGNVANPAGANARLTGEIFKENFDKELQIHLDEPRSLFVKDSATVDSDTYTDRVLARPSGNLLYSYTEDNSIDPVFEIDTEY